ncbi:MAG: DUF5916 domain-containing protein [Planctomycetota bacterium]|nr:DUF5916 domain-containing protein [Planctomycetota bacterium]
MRRMPAYGVLVGFILPFLALTGAAAGGDGSLPRDGTPEARASRWGEFPALGLVRIDEPPIIDGVPDEPVWRDAPIIDDFRQVEPVEGGAPSQRTEVRLLYDHTHLYVSFRCLDGEPDRIVVTEMKRDGSLGSDDFIRFIIGPFFDRRNGYLFEMNALGARGDGLVEDNDDVRRDWDGIWTGRASIDETGWAVEAAIPFETLSFNPNTTRWSFNAMRFIRRRNETLRWASPSRDRSFIALADAGVLEGIDGIERGVGLDIEPYVVSTLKRDHESDRDGFDFDAGLDVFYRFTPSLTLALTLNTDFAETEVDERRVNLTRFPLFFPEKRDFFLQDAGIFDFGGIRRNPLPFFSRRIGLGPSGETRDILAGAKLTGRVGDLNLGLLDVQMKHDEELGDKNLLVARAAVNVLQQSTVGAIFTNGDPRTDGDNWLAGLDFNYRTSRFAGDKTVTGHLWGLTADSTGVDHDQSAWGIKLSYPNDRIRWGWGYSQIDENFNAALGFVPRRGIREHFANWRYRWRPESSLIRTIDSGVSGTLITDLDDEVESRRLTFELIDIATEAGDRAGIDFTRQREVLAEPFEISEGVILPVGDYRFDRYGINLRSSRGRPVSVNFGLSGGTFYSGTRRDYSAGLEWRVSPHLFLGAEYQMNDVKLDEGDFISRIIRGRANVQFTPDLAWTNFIQYDNRSESVGINSRVRWIVKPGSEVYFVLNQAIDRDDSSFRVRRTELTTKAGWTLRF